VSHDINTNIWHSNCIDATLDIDATHRQHVINFGSMSWLACLNLIPKFDVIRSPKCYAYVEAKQPHKPHKAATGRELALLNLIHSDVCDKMWQEIFLNFHRCLY